MTTIWDLMLAHASHTQQAHSASLSSSSKLATKDSVKKTRKSKDQEEDGERDEAQVLVITRVRVMRVTAPSEDTDQHLPFART